MSRRSRSHRSTSIASSLGALLLAASVLTGGPASAHSFTKQDPNDTAGLLDLRSASVAHRSRMVVHSFRTFAGWAPSDLGRNSSGFVIGIDRNNDARQAERCVFVVFLGGRLRAFMTDCVRTLSTLAVSKPNRTTVKVNIPQRQAGFSYRWAVVSLYFEKKPCLNGCADGIPNLTSFILHDLIPPTVSMDTDPLRVWETSVDASFSFPFTVSDTGGAGVKSWTVQRRPIGAGSWTNVVSGTGGGARTPTITGTEATRFDYRVVAKDKHLNTKIGPIRRVYIPMDDDDLAGGFSAPPTPVADASAFGGSYSTMTVATSTFTHTWTPGADCVFELVGPGSGTWEVTVIPNGGSPTTIDDLDFSDQPRQTLYTDSTCATSYVITLNSGVFGLDAVLG